MSMYVYKDRERKEKLLIKDATERDKGIRYFCPNSNCNARMFLWNLEGESKSFFRASGTPGHVENCPFGSDNTYNPNNTKEEGFDSDDAIAKLMTGGNTQTSTGGSTGKHDSKEAKEVVPHTIGQIYNMCKAHYCKDTFNGQVIGQILVDGRSIYMYPKGIYGYRLIEARCRARLYNGASIFLETPIDDAKYQLELKIKDAKLFREIRDLLYANRDHVIVVAGKWESSGIYNCFSTEFNNKKQIKILKQTI